MVRSTHQVLHAVNDGRDVIGATYETDEAVGVAVVEAAEAVHG